LPALHDLPPTWSAAPAKPEARPARRQARTDPLRDWVRVTGDGLVLLVEPHLVLLARARSRVHGEPALLRARDDAAAGASTPAAQAGRSAAGSVTSGSAVLRDAAAGSACASLAAESDGPSAVLP